VPVTSIVPFLRDGDVILKGYSIVKGSGAEESWEALLRELVPTPQIIEQVNNFRAEAGLTGSYVSVQIRVHKHSHGWTQDASPLEWFVGRMRELAEDSATRFFVSADTRSAQADILRRFPTAVALPPARGYNSRASLVKSVADLYLLAAGTRILAPYYSSFAETAWALSGRAQVLEDALNTRPAVPHATPPPWAAHFQR
jgi:hypothetical protein